jgi:hypothetical protein
MPTASAQMAIDGKWVECLPAEDYGFLGVREVCELKSEAGQTAKKLLLRYLLWPPSGPGGAARLVAQPLPAGHALDLRPVLGKAYHRVAAGGPPRPEACQVLQQDVTGLLTLKAALVQASRAGNFQQVWKHFYAGCKALDSLCQAAGAGGSVTLQCPASLAVAPDGRVVLLDAELRVDGPLAAAPGAQAAFTTWFGAAGAAGVAPSKDASLMHADALLRYFRHVLGGLQQQAEPAGVQALSRVNTRLGQARPGMDLDELEGWIRGAAGEWDIVLEDEPAVVGAAAAPAGAAVPAAKGPSQAAARPPRSWLLRTSLWLNLLLVGAVVALWLLRPSGSGGSPRPSPAEEPGHLFSSYCVVLPVQGTSGDRVHATLVDLFPGTAVEAKGGNGERRLGQKLDEVAKSLAEPEKLKQLLGRLAANHAVRFKGFAAGDGGDNLKAVIERGGIYSLGGESREEYGSLLQADSLSRILDRAGPDGQGEARTLLADLRRAVLEYASLHDALTVLGDRPGFLVHVEPTAAAHDKARQALVGRRDKPVFVSRPVPQLFDAVDPTADTGGGSAAYSLKLERKSFFRVAGRDNRQDVDFRFNRSNDRLKWQTFAPNETIVWRPVPLMRKSGKAEAVSTFDIAVAVPPKVVVFRNQTIFVGESKAEVRQQAQNYVTKVLGLRVPEIDDAVSIKKQDEQFTGALIYSFLADQCRDKPSSSGGDLEVLSGSAFQEARTAEDNALK